MYHRDGDLAPGGQDYYKPVSELNDKELCMSTLTEGSRLPSLRGQQNLFVVWDTVLLQTHPQQGTLGCHVCSSEDGTEVETHFHKTLNDTVRTRTREEANIQWARSVVSAGFPVSFFDNKEVRKSVLFTSECGINYIGTKYDGRPGHSSFQEQLESVGTLCQQSMWTTIPSSMSSWCPFSTHSVFFH